eukprot:TRINITY_DN25339_c0_g1_i1.p1 TRINITY_DN25339_c0_g1~~TRINITY_DN25339_c0_g1_i1.p1  ORF type:complete len:118 (-),score=12.03 TRINITY_DN25339_c0_g1_i1:160-513(-)
MAFSSPAVLIRSHLFVTMAFEDDDCEAVMDAAYVSAWLAKFSLSHSKVGKCGICWWRCKLFKAQLFSVARKVWIVFVDRDVELAKFILRQSNVEMAGQAFWVAFAGTMFTYVGFGGL